MRNLKWIFLILTLTIVACSTSKITTSWKAKDIPVKKYNKILVLALINDKDRRIRERMEQHFVGDLTNLGYTAISALQEYGPKAFDSLAEKAALEKIKNSGVEAVVTIVLLDKQKKDVYIAPQVYSKGFGAYYENRQNSIFEPGYYVSDTKYLWESNFYDMSNDSLLYSVQTKSFSPKNIESMGHEYGQKIVKSMRREKILQKQIAQDD